jgi:hypothetical protein
MLASRLQGSRLGVGDALGALIHAVMQHISCIEASAVTFSKDLQRVN